MRAFTQTTDRTLTVNKSNENMKITKDHIVNGLCFTFNNPQIVPGIAALEAVVVRAGLLRARLRGGQRSIRSHLLPVINF